MAGWSMGGAVTQRFAEVYPNKVSKIVLMGTTPKWINSNGWTAGAAPFALFPYIETMSRFTGTVNNMIPIIAAFLGLLDLNLAPQAIQNSFHLLRKRQYQRCLYRIQKPNLMYLLKERLRGMGELSFLQLPYQH